MKPNMYEIFKTGFQVAYNDKSGQISCMMSATRHLLRTQSYFVEKGKKVEIDNAVGFAPDMQYFKCQNEKGICPWDVIPMVVAGFSIPLSELENWISDARNIIDQYSKIQRLAFH